MAARATPSEEAFLPFKVPKASVPLTTQFRSTWLTGSIMSLRERGLLERYLSYLPAEYHEPVMHSVAGVWLPDKIAVAHYRACDALNLPVTEIIDIGLDVSRRLHASLLSLFVKLAKGVGVTPWTAFAHVQKLWDRIWIGGSMAVYKLGPKEARIEVAGWTSAGVPYCRIAFRGVMHGVTETFCTKVYVHELPRLCGPTELGYRVAWA